MAERPRVLTAFHDMQVYAGQRVVAVVAHPDDESFPCGSLIARCVASGAHVTVICATRGELGERVADPATDHVPLGELRVAEFHAAAQVLGVHEVHVLHHGDSGFDGPFPDGALCAVPVEEVAAALLARADVAGAEVLLSFDGSDGHRDHLHVRAALELVQRASTLRPRLVMASLPNSLMRRWVHEAQARQPDRAYLDLDVETLGAPDEVLVHVPADEYYELRQRAIACHASQRSPYDDLSDDLRRAFLATDHLLEVPAGDT